MKCAEGGQTPPRQLVFSGGHTPAAGHAEVAVPDVIRAVILGRSVGVLLQRVGVAQRRATDAGAIDVGLVEAQLPLVLIGARLVWAMARLDCRHHHIPQLGQRAQGQQSFSSSTSRHSERSALVASGGVSVPRRTNAVRSMATTTSAMATLITAPWTGQIACLGLGLRKPKYWLENIRNTSHTSLVRPRHRPARVCGTRGGYSEGPGKDSE